MDDLDQYFLETARFVSSKSAHPSTQVGCVIVGQDRRIKSTGYNRPPKGMSVGTWLAMGPDRTFATVHAEVDAISSAALAGVSVSMCTAYITHPPCGRCAGLMVQSGIRRFVWPHTSVLPPKWKQDLLVAQYVLSHADVDFPQEGWP